MSNSSIEARHDALYRRSKDKKKGNRILIVETSAKAEYALTRAFYKKCKYPEQAVIPKFYDVGENKVIFWKI